MQELILSVSTYLVVNCNKLSHHMKGVFARIYNRSFFLPDEPIQCSLSHDILPHSFFFHLLPDYSRDGPMVFR
jgi:hypothetical protein